MLLKGKKSVFLNFSVGSWAAVEGCWIYKPQLQSIAWKICLVDLEI